MKRGERTNRSDQSVLKVRKEMSKHLKLPLEAVRIVLPSKRLPRPNKTIGELRKAWNGR